MSAALVKLVPPSDKPERTAAEAALDLLLPELIAAERVTARLHQLVAEQSRILANERGLTVRPRVEQLKQEFLK